jgi:phenylpropionate dioxygenase-like ring-hydroxylating dioxygenase large terminal subunit
MTAGHLPFPNDPFSWFGVGWSDDFSPGDVKAAHYFDRELVLWRDHAGTMHVQDAYCPHLGAHLGIGGKVTEDNCLQCPFHGWEYGADGACTNVPYSDRINRKARIRTYTVEEKSGIVLVWYHPAGDEPSFTVPEVPEFADTDFTDYVRRSWEVRAPLQEMGENSADPAHFRYVHGTDTVPVVDSYEIDGAEWRIFTTQRFPTPRGVVDARIDVESFGRGLSITRFKGIIDTCLVSWTTPIDARSSHVNFGFMTRKLDDAHATSSVSDAFMAEVTKQLTEDIPIWENKVHLEVPALAAEDGPIMEYRKWCAQFYVAPEEREAATA